MSAIKLLKVDQLQDGTVRFQSQLMVGRDAVDFIMKDNIMKCYGHGERGFNFYEYTQPYTIVETIEDMTTQEL